jgi:FkbM family methyltransferase
MARPLSTVRRLRQLADHVRRALPRPASAIVQVGGLELEVDPRTEIGYVLWRDHGFEARERDVAAALFASRGAERAIIDVGAHVGVHGLAWAKMFAKAPVVAIEPAPKTVAQLARNVKRNGLHDRVRVLECALGAHTGEGALQIATDDAYSGLFDTGRKPIQEVVPVRIRTLDEVAAELAVPLGLVKIDVEGHERAVIAGGRATIERDHPVLFVEIYGGIASNPAPAATVEEIKELGYTAYVLGAHGLERFTQHDDRRYNYFFVPNR